MVLEDGDFVFSLHNGTFREDVSVVNRASVGRVARPDVTEVLVVEPGGGSKGPLRKRASSAVRACHLAMGKSAQLTAARNGEVDSGQRAVAVRFKLSAPENIALMEVVVIGV